VQVVDRHVDLGDRQPADPLDPAGLAMTWALNGRLDGTEAVVLCGDSNELATIEAVRAAIPRRACLSLALLDPPGCTLHLDTIKVLTFDRPMDLLINLPIHSLYRCLAAGDWHVLDAVLGPDWPRCPPRGVPGWPAAIRAHCREKLRELGYGHFSAKEVCSETRNSALYDFILAGRHDRAKQLFEDVTKETAHGQLRLM